MNPATPDTVLLADTPAVPGTSMSERMRTLLFLNGVGLLISHLCFKLCPQGAIAAQDQPATTTAGSTARPAASMISCGSSTMNSNASVPAAKPSRSSSASRRRARPTSLH